MFPELFTLPLVGMAVQTYSVLIAAGFVLATWVIVADARRAGEPKPDRYADLAFYCLLIGIFGSRVLFVIVNWRLYADRPLDIVMLRQGGLVFYGGFLTAMAFVVGWCRYHGEPFFKVADRLILGVSLNHVFGRLGCLAAGCCFGAPWAHGIVYPIASAVHQLQVEQGLVAIDMPSLPVHASPVYEALGELALFALMMALRARKRFDGQLLLIWLTLYPILRSIVEMTRGDVQRGFIGPLSTSQVISIGVALLAAFLLLRLRTFMDSNDNQRT